MLPWQHANKVYCLNYILLDAERQTPFNPDAMDIERKQNLGSDTVQDTTRNCKFLHVKLSVLPLCTGLIFQSVLSLVLS